MKKLVEILLGANVHAKHTSIKGRKSGGTRDINGNDWKKEHSHAGIM